MKNTSACITLLTDFGFKDHYVASMKGVIYSINPRVRIVDIVHSIPPQDVEAAAFQIFTCYRFFPGGTIHVAVVDPGVGSRRKMIAVKTSHYYFIAPDNGILSYVLQHEKKKVIREITNKNYFLPEVSCTFHARDIFAPVAAYLSHRRKHNNATIFKELGTLCKNPVLLPLAQVKGEKSVIQGQVIAIDTFGNIITNVLVSELAGCRNILISIKGKSIKGISVAYASVPRGKLVAVKGSSRFLEIARREGSAARYLKAKRGTAVTIHRGGK